MRESDWLAERFQERRGHLRAVAAATAINGGDDLTRGRRMLFALENVTYIRAGRRLVSDLNVRLEVRTTALVDSSRAGKSTLLRLLNRLADPDSGTITYRGQDVRDHDCSSSREIALGPQIPALLPGTVFENVAYRLRSENNPVLTRHSRPLAGGVRRRWHERTPQQAGEATLPMSDHEPR
jgi:ABC-type multidrug transport system fused ATPase/permease subunit